MGDVFGTAAAAAPAADATGAAGGSGGFDPSAGMGGTDPGFGMGSFDPSTGLGAGDIGAGSSFGSFSGQIPGDPTSSLSARQSINPQGLNQPPITDQPAPAPQAASQTLPQSANPAWMQQVMDVNHALFHGPTAMSMTPGASTSSVGPPASGPGEPGTPSNPASPGGPGYGPGASVRTPFGTAQVPGNPPTRSIVPGSKFQTPWGEATVPFNTPVTEGNPLPIDDSLSNVIGRNLGRGGALGGLLGTALAPTPANQGEPDIPQTGETVTPVQRPPATETFTGDMTGSGEPLGTGESSLSASQELTGGSTGSGEPLGTGPSPIPIGGSGEPLGTGPSPIPTGGSGEPLGTGPKPPPTSPAATPPAATPPAATSPAATPPSSTPGATPGTGGRGMASPLEQLIGGFLHMLLGQIGPMGGMLEQMIDRALGINPQRLFTGGGFNPPPPRPGSGYLPAGTTGGRQAGQPGAPLSPDVEAYFDQFGAHSTLGGIRQLNNKGLDPGFAQRLEAAGQEYTRQTGRNPAFGEGYRDPATQQRYWEESHHGRDYPAAPPGLSRHQRGAAMDMPDGHAFTRWLQTGNNARKFGLGFPVRNDPNHIQMIDDGQSARALGTQFASLNNVQSDARPQGMSSYVSPQSISNSRIEGSDTRPTPGYSTTMRDARARAFEGMDDQTKKLVAAMASLEKDRDPIGPIESLFNRSAFYRTPIKTLLSNRFYSTQPRFESQIARLENSGQIDRYMRAIDDVQRGSNVLAGATDQGMAGVKNTANPSGRIVRFNETYNDHSQGAARWRQQIQRQVQQEFGDQQPQKEQLQEEKTARTQPSPRRPPGMTEAQRRILNRRRRRVASEDMIEA